MIHVIADSHGSIFSQDGFAVSNRPWCAHNLIDDDKKSILLDYIKNNVKDGDKVILVHGEIDCRIHFYKKHLELGIPISELINNTIIRYGELMKILSEMKIDFAVYNVVPTGTWSGDSYGPMEIRKRIYKEFHDKLAAFCRAYEYKIIDVWDLVAGKDGFTKPEYRSDEVHLNTAAKKIVMDEVKRVFNGQI